MWQAWLLGQREVSDVPDEFRRAYPRRSRAFFEKDNHSSRPSAEPGGVRLRPILKARVLMLRRLTPYPVFAKGLRLTQLPLVGSFHLAFRFCKVLNSAAFREWALFCRPPNHFLWGRQLPLCWNSREFWNALDRHIDFRCDLRAVAVWLAGAFHRKPLCCRDTAWYPGLCATNWFCTSVEHQPSQIAA